MVNLNISCSFWTLLLLFVIFKKKDRILLIFNPGPKIQFRKFNIFSVEVYKKETKLKQQKYALKCIVKNKTNFT